MKTSLKTRMAVLLLTATTLLYMRPEGFGLMNPVQGHPSVKSDLWIALPSNPQSAHGNPKQEQDRFLPRAGEIRCIKPVDLMLEERVQVAAFRSRSMDDKLYLNKPAPCLKYPVGLYNSFL